MKKKEKRLWFKAKLFGWGWYPTTWEGAIITLAYILIIIKESVRFMQTGKNNPAAFYSFFPMLLILTAMLIFICYKTGEKPEWRWIGKSMFKKK